MEREERMALPGGAEFPGEEAARGTDGHALKGRRGPTWRGFAVSIVVAVVLSVMATLLLGGSLSSYSLRPAAGGLSGGCGPLAPCCPVPPEEGK